MTEAAQAAKLWVNFHHLTEFDQNLVIDFVKTIEISPKYVPWQERGKREKGEGKREEREI